MTRTTCRCPQPPQTESHDCSHTSRQQKAQPITAQLRFTETLPIPPLIKKKALLPTTTPRYTQNVLEDWERRRFSP